MENQTDKQQEVRRLLLDLAEAKGTGAKLDAASSLLAELGLIPNTPAGKTRWISDIRQL